MKWNCLKEFLAVACLLTCVGPMLGQRVDSLAKGYFKFVPPLDTSRFPKTALPDTVPTGWKRDFPKNKLMPRIGGRISTEVFHTSFQNLRVLSAPTYVRVHGSTHMSWMGIPLILDFYKTSESQTLYNSNYLRMSFDKSAFLSQFSKDWKTTLKKAEKDLELSKFKQQETSKLEKTLENEKNELLSQEDKIKRELETKRRVYQLKYQTQYDSAYQLVEDSMASTKHRAVPATRRDIPKKEQVRDSLTMDRLYADSLKLTVAAQKWTDRYNKIMARRRTLDSTISADSAKVVEYKELIRDPEKHMRDWLLSHRLPEQLVWLSYIRDFQIGLTNPVFHPYSLYGIGMKGLNTSFRFGKLDLDLAGGKAIIADLSNYNRQNSKYERLFLGVSGSFELPGGRLQLFTHYSQDPQEKFTKAGRPAFRSYNSGLNFKTLFFKVSSLDLSVATGNASISNREIKSIVYPSTSTTSQIVNLRSALAHWVRIENQLSKSLNLEISDQFVGPRFKNFGNPFMRTNFREQQAKLKITLFRQQLNVAAFYKTFRDNPLSLSEITNRTSGYGLSLATRFKNKRLPNFNASVTPYEQGNNHPDSLFRINSKYAIVSAGMNYHIGRGRLKYFVLINGSQSQMALNDSFSSRVQSLNANHEITLGKYLSFGNSVTVVRTWPMVDSIQLNVFQGRIAYRAVSGNQILLNLQYSQYLNGAYRKGVSISSTIKFKKTFRLTLRTGYDLYYRIWGIYKQEAFSGLARLEFSF